MTTTIAVVLVLELEPDDIKRDGIRALAGIVRASARHVGLRRPLFVVAYVEPGAEPTRVAHIREQLRAAGHDQAWHRGDFVLHAPAPPHEPKEQACESGPPSRVKEFCAEIASDLKECRPIRVSRGLSRDFALTLLEKIAEVGGGTMVLMSPIAERKQVDFLDPGSTPWLKSDDNRWEGVGQAQPWLYGPILKLTSLELEHFRGWVGDNGKLSEIDANVIILAGSNGLGKTSAFDAITRVLSGSHLFKDEELTAKTSISKDWRVAVGARSLESPESTFTFELPYPSEFGELYKSYLSYTEELLGRPNEVSKVVSETTMISAEDVRRTLENGSVFDLIDRVRDQHLTLINEIVVALKGKLEKTLNELGVVSERISNLEKSPISKDLKHFIREWNRWISDNRWAAAKGFQELLPVDEWTSQGWRGWVNFSTQLHKFESTASERLGTSSDLPIFDAKRLLDFHSAAKRSLSRIAQDIARSKEPGESTEERRALERSRQDMEKTRDIPRARKLLLWASSSLSSNLKLDDVVSAFANDTVRWSTPPPELLHEAAIQGIVRELREVDIVGLQTVASPLLQTLRTARKVVQEYDRIVERLNELGESSVSVAEWEQEWQGIPQQQLEREQTRINTDRVELERQSYALKTRAELLDALVQDLDRTRYPQAWEEAEKSMRSMDHQPSIDGDEERIEEPELRHDQEAAFTELFQQALRHFPSFAQFFGTDVVDHKAIVRLNDAATLDYSHFSSGQKGQAALAWLISQSRMLQASLPHRVLLLDDPCAFFDSGNLAPFAAWIRQLAYATDPKGRRQVFISTPDEATLEALVANLIPPSGCEMRVVQFESWSPEFGPKTTTYTVDPEPRARLSEPQPLDLPLDLFWLGDLR